MIDIFCVIIAGYGFYTGYSRGIIETVFNLVSMFIGILAALKLTPVTTRVLESAFDSDNPLMFVAGFLLTFVTTMVMLRLVARGLEGLLMTAHINSVNQVAGGVLLAVVLLLFYSTLLWFGDQARLISDRAKSESITYPYLEPMPAKAKRLAVIMQPYFREFWQKSVDVMDRLRDMNEKPSTDRNATDHTSNE